MTTNLWPQYNKPHSTLGLTFTLRRYRVIAEFVLYQSNRPVTPSITPPFWLINKEFVMRNIVPTTNGTGGERVWPLIIIALYSFCMWIAVRGEPQATPSVRLTSVSISVVCNNRDTFMWLSDFVQMSDLHGFNSSLPNGTFCVRPDLANNLILLISTEKATLGETVSVLTPESLLAGWPTKKITILRRSASTKEYREHLEHLFNNL